MAELLPPHRHSYSIQPHKPSCPHDWLRESYPSRGDPNWIVAKAPTGDMFHLVNDNVTNPESSADGWL